MPRLEKIRLTHIQYNNKHNVIRDEILDLKGQSTLLKLANGGGKSVMTQMLLAPYVSSGNKRNFKGRPFLDYFKDEAPSFIVQEWKMDENDNRFLVGIMVRKSSTISNQEEGKDKKADFYAFVAEYTEPCEYDIDHLPLLSETNGRKTWLTFSKGKDLLAKMNTEHDRNFFWYNMNNTSHRQKYAEKLAELGIDRSEWDQLQTFNQDESGLSAFCDTYNTEEKLVKNVFIPAVAAKIDEENSPNQLEKPSVIEAMQKNMKSFALQQLDNQDKLDQKKDYETFLAFLQDLSGQTEALANLEQQQYEHMEALIRDYLGACEARDSADETLEGLQDQLADLQEESRTIEYEILSAAYWKIAAQIEKKEQKLASQKEKESQLDSQVKQETVQLNRMDCSRVYQQGQDLKGRIAYFQEKVDAALRSDEETRVQMETYAGGLKVLFERAIEQNEAKSREETLRKQGLQEQLDSALLQETNLQNTRVETEKAIGSLQAVLDAYTKRENAFVKKWNVVIPHTLEPWKDQPILENIQKEQEEQKAKLEEQIRQSEASQSSLEARIEKLSSKRSNLSLQENQLNQEIKALEQKKDEKDLMVKDRQNLLRRLGISLDLLWDAEEIKQSAESRRQSLDHRLKLNLQEQSEIERKKSQLETGCVLELSEPIEKVLDQLGIEKVTGAAWLREVSMHHETKKKMIRDFPWLPYCLLMSKDQETQFFKALEEEKLYTAQPIPVLDRDALNHSPEQVLNPSSGLHVYVHFNEQLITPSKLKELLESLGRRLEEEQKQQSLLQQEQEDLQKAILQACLDYTREQYNKLLHEIETKKTSQAKIHEEQSDLELSLARSRQNLKNLQNDLTRQNKDLRKKEDLLERFGELISEYASAVSAHQEMQEKQSDLEGCLKALEACRSKQEDLRHKLSDLQDLLKDLSVKKNALEKEAAQYAQAVSREPQLPMEELLSRYSALQSQLNASDLQENQRQLSSCQASLKENEASLKQMEKAFDLSPEEYQPLNASMSDYLKQKEHLAKLTESLKTTRDQISQESSALAALQERRAGNLGRITELNGMTKPLAKDQVRTIDLKAEKKVVDEKIQTVQSSCSKTEHRMQNIESLIGNVSGLIDQSFDYEQYSASPGWTDMPVSIMREQFDRWKGRSESLQGQVRKMELSITQALHAHSKRYPPNQDVLLDVLAGLERIIEQPQHLHETLLEKKSLIEQDLARLEEDLKNLAEQKEQTAQILYEYVERMHRNIKKIDANTTITVRDHARKMLDIGMADFDRDKEIYKQKSREMVESILDGVLKDPNHLDTIVETNLTPVNLYNAVVGIHTISVHVYKIEEVRETRITWREAGKASGAEGFLCAFIVVTAVMNFQRHQQAGYIGAKKQSNVLIMDNPFAKTQSGHIVKALMNLCEKTNTQMIAFTAVENSVIINAFNNIYNLRFKHGWDNKDYMDAIPARSTGEADDREEMENIHIQVESAA